TALRASQASAQRSQCRSDMWCSRAASGHDDPAAGLLVLAVDPGTAARLAVVSTTATLTVSLPPP
ncbi:MAG: hypothetical protein ACLGI3_21180, partial [Actinomycetes bacterium]